MRNIFKRNSKKRNARFAVIETQTVSLGCEGCIYLNKGECKKSPGLKCVVNGQPVIHEFVIVHESKVREIEKNKSLTYLRRD